LGTKFLEQNFQKLGNKNSENLGTKNDENPSKIREKIT
jgi:hypothetical protein